MKNGTTDPKNPPWFELQLGDAALPAWADYFGRHLRWMPWGMKMLEQRKNSIFLVPCEQPEWFDVNYAPPPYLPHWPPRDPEATPESRARVGELARLSRGAGLQSMEDAARDTRREQRARQELERQARRIEAANAAAGIATPEGHIPVSESLRRIITGSKPEPMQEAAE